MKVLFVSNLCDRETFNELFKMRTKAMISPSQKFYDLLIRGMGACERAEITCLSARPVSASSVRKKLWRTEIKHIGKQITYWYLPFWNSKILRHATLFIGTFFGVLKWLHENKGNPDNVIVCDSLVYMCSVPARMAAKLKCTKTVSFLTDLPRFANAKREKVGIKQALVQMLDKFAENDMVKYDGYIILTEKMNGIVNPDGKQSLVVECSVDISEKETGNSSENKNDPRTILYAGGVYAKYGLDKLVKAFIKADIENAQLCIYGDGDYAAEIEKISKTYSNINYMGCVGLEEIVENERKATLLVNPRPTREAFTPYSFPSKTAEYMVSGTPVLSTRLEGIPEEYGQYLYWFQEETVVGLADTMVRVMSKGNQELSEFGMVAKEFMLTNKNNLLQGQKILDFLQSIMIK
jgi:glycosyltransferase involved in cell wall biosynthesis